MKKIRIILIDDEEMALNNLKYVLEQYEELDIKGIFSDPLEALGKIIDIKPDVVFLDIEMPEINGFIIGEEILNLMPNVIIVFVTAFVEYSVKAFEANAIDYVLKPLSKKRIDQTVAKIIKYNNFEQMKMQKGCMLENKMFGNYIDKIIAWKDDKIMLLNPSQVLFFSADGRNIYVITENDRMKTKNTLNYWEKRLAVFNFFRCHNSYLINMDKIEIISPSFNYTYAMKLVNYSHDIPVSREKSKILKIILDI